jgi:hypothetical protein
VPQSGGGLRLIRAKGQGVDVWVLGVGGDVSDGQQDNLHNKARDTIVKRFNTLLFGFLILVVAGCGRQAPSGDSPKSNLAAEKAAVESAQAWLDLVDAGSYSKSWDEAAAVLKSAVSQADLEKSLRAVRTPLGKVVSRNIKSQQYTTSLPGAPVGEYVVIQFDTTFEHKANATETITPMLDKTGKWKVSGYFIK